MPQGSKENFLSVLLESLGQVGMAYPKVKAQQEQQNRQSQMDALSQALQQAQLAQRKKEFAYGQERDVKQDMLAGFRYKVPQPQQPETPQLPAKVQELQYLEQLLGKPGLIQHLIGGGQQTGQAQTQPQPDKMPPGWGTFLQGILSPEWKQNLEGDWEQLYPNAMPTAGFLDSALAAFRGQPYPQAQAPISQPTRGQQDFGGASSYQDVLQWYNDNPNDPRRDSILQKAKQHFGVQ